MKINYRPSMAPGFWKCPSYGHQGDSNTVFEAGVAAKIGTALHKIFEKRISHGEKMSVEELVEFASAHGVDADGFNGIKWRYYKLVESWDKVSQYFSNPSREVTLSAELPDGTVLTGTPDLAEVFEAHAVVFDLKTGLIDQDYTPQLREYAYLIWKNNPVQEVYGILFSPMLNKYSVHKWTWDEMAEHEVALTKRLELRGTVESPGDQCKWCAKALRCRTMLDAIDPLCAEIRERSDADMQISEDDIRRMRPTIKVMKRIIEAYETAEHAAIYRFGGRVILDAEAGTELRLVHRERKTIKPAIAYETLQAEGVSHKAIVDAMKLSSTGLMDAAREVAVPRSKTHGVGVLKERINQTLIEKMGIETTTYELIVEGSTPALEGAERDEK